MHHCKHCFRARCQQNVLKMVGELCVSKCHLPVLDVYILSGLTPLKMQCSLTTYASGKESKFLLDIARSLSESGGKCEKRSTKKEIDSSGEMTLKVKNPQYLSLVDHVTLEASERNLRESRFFHSVNPAFLSPDHSSLHKVLQIQHKPHTGRHHRLDETHLSITRTLPQLSGSCRNLCQQSLHWGLLQAFKIRTVFSFYFSQALY